MNQTRKITVEVPEDVLKKAQAFTGDGITQTVTQGLKRLAAIQAQQELRTLRGSFRFTLDLDGLRDDRK